MSWLVTAKQYIPAVIGEEFGGGYFAGYISHTADGNPTHALIVAPRETGASGTGYTLTTNYQWKTTATSTAGTNNLFDGAVNTAAMVAAGIADHPAAQFCVNLNIGGFTDWYLPSRAEYEIAYFNLKPSTTFNLAFMGSNIYSVPRRDNFYTATYPAQTYLDAFRTTSEAFVAVDHWRSDQASESFATRFLFSSGADGGALLKTFGFPVRAFRKIAL